MRQSRLKAVPPVDPPEFTEDTARTIIRALLKDFEHIVWEELDRSYGVPPTP
jgi:hypothetical protein